MRTYGCRHRRHCRHRSLPPPPLTHHSNLQIHTLYFEHNKNSLRLRANDYDNGGSVPAREHSVHSHGYMHARDEGDTGTRRGQKHSFMKQNTIHALNSFPLTQSMTSMETNVTCVVRVTRCGTRRASVCAHASICLRRPAHVSVYHLFSFFHKTSWRMYSFDWTVNEFIAARWMVPLWWINSNWISLFHCISIQMREHFPINTKDGILSQNRMRLVNRI